MANGGETAFSLSVSISSEDAREFLTKLANNPEFHKQFENDPKGVLEGIDGVELSLPSETLLPEPYKPPSMEQLQEFVKTGYPPKRPNPPVYNGGCIVWSVLYGIASRTETEYEDASAPS
jgi:hypothetical protein